MAAMMNIMISIPTTKTTSFSYMVTKNRRSQCFKHVDGFALKSSPTDKNDVVLSTLSKDEISSGGVSYMLDSASDVVTSFYDGINSRDLSRVTDLIAEDCVYEDLVFPKPIVGRKDILEFFEKFIYTISQDLQFVIDDISGEDTSAIGVTWHLVIDGVNVAEWKGKPFPFRKGCSFYRLQVFNGKRKIVLIIWINIVVLWIKLSVEDIVGALQLSWRHFALVRDFFLITIDMLKRSILDILDCFTGITFIDLSKY
ncbi:polyketide cyclase SnoaL-like domain-containing protein [Tanacetum coccineum]